MLEMSTADLIKAGRLRLGMSHSRFGDALGVSRGAVQQWENSATGPSRKHQPAVAKLLGIGVGELMAGVSAKYPTEKPPQPKVNESSGHYSADPCAEAAHLLRLMNGDGQREAVAYLRYLTQRHPVELPVCAADSPGDTLPRAKAA
jgi:transcriptional regulator with XRE-family HTH domain